MMVGYRARNVRHGRNMTMNRKLALVALAISAVGVANAQSNQNLNFGIGGSYGILYLQDDAMKTAFGSSIVRFGITPVNLEQRQRGIFPGWEVISASANGNNLFLLPVTYGWEQHFGDEGPFKPFFRVFGGIAYMDYGVTVGATRYSSRTFGTTWGLELGASVSDKLRISARYNAFAKQDGLSFNNIELTATYTHFKL